MNKVIPSRVLGVMHDSRAWAGVRRLPIEDMWRHAPLPKDLRPPPSFGDHGLSKNRFTRLRALAGQLWDASLDDEASSKRHEYSADKDMWRWAMTPIECFNEHYHEVLKPGSLVGPDETIVPSDHQEGPAPQQIPHAHFVPRKPKDTGAELNTIADGQCGGIFRLDIERGKTDPWPRKYENEWGYTSALNFRLGEN